ncbi:LOW QUALITY PROTEIN: uncharacterized protein LOC117648239 [Thrips palmi]|uniref:LOW QUALITY PROTEIN: uncharacterized protein LOC117648239 n=1 Tax=Thrips palmi TaxID=161013 RepID=A0A6P8Z205_THRPL|nr:LOW QUALITY PROTEIN: uncharacterized protein LOC117648239 [Thrips palmi]
MLTAVLNLVASVGAVGVLAGVVSGIIFLVDTALQWGSSQRTSLEPWADTTTKTTVYSAANDVAIGTANGTANGVVHCAVNGTANGVVHRAANGTANGAVNGLANGAVNGLVNGVVNGVLHSAVNGTSRHHTGIGREVPDVWFQQAADAPALIRVPLQSLQSLEDFPRDDAKLTSVRRPRSGAGDGESQCDMGEADDVPEVLGVRQLMERLVESLVSGGLDDVALRPANPHPQYGRIYKRHQPRLRSALTSLAYSLQMAMAQKPLAESETPGRAHAQLRAVILDLARDVANLDKDGVEANGVVDALEEDFTARAYEDILATAIVNKVMERSSTKNNKKINNNNNNNNFVSSLEVRVGSLEDSPESCTSSYTESWTGSGSHLDHSLEDVDSDPLSLMIEECIEEVTTITATSSSSASSSDERSEGDEAVREVPVVRRRRRRRSSRRRGSATAAALPPLPPSGPPSLIAGLSFMKQRVPFPELGVDIVDADWSSADSELSEASVRLRNGSDGDSDAEGWRPAPRPEKPDGAEDDVIKAADGDGGDEDRPASCLELVTPLQSWEDNWLFQSKRIRKPAAQYAHHPVPVPMLVPNPSEDFRALIGDVDAEETSDLSECSDDALEEVVLAGMAPRSDQFTEDLGLSEASRAHLGGLAETCNLELLRRVAPSLSTAPVPRAHRTDRSPNLDQPGSPSDRLSPVGKTPSRTSTLSGRSSTRSPVDLAGRWARDQDAEQTVVYDTPTRREAPAKHKAAAKHKTAAKVEDAAVAAANPEHVQDSAAASTPSTTSPESQPAPPRPEPVQEPVEVVQEVAVVADAMAEVVDAEPAAADEAPAVNGHGSPGDADDADDAVLATPPRPGTIADREHRKWQQATPLANNPYSPENIQRRLQQRASSASLRGAMEAVGAVGAVGVGAELPPNGAAPAGTDTTLHIALRVDPDPKKYGRDFYINSNGHAGSGSSGTGLRRSQSTTVADRRSSLLDSPIAPWSSAVRTTGDGGSEESSSLCSPASPSVRELAKQFLSQPQEQPSQVRAAKSSDALAKVVIVGKEAADSAPPLAQHARKAVRQVHSLTARSMSREFREGLRHIAASAAVPARAAAATSPSTPSPPSPADATQGRPDPEGARQPADAE